MIQKEVLEFSAFLAFSDEELLHESVFGPSKKSHFLTNEGTNARANCAGSGRFPRREITKNAHNIDQSAYALGFLIQLTLFKKPR
jgi:hypothetical protein